MTREQLDRLAQLALETRDRALLARTVELLLSVVRRDLSNVDYSSLASDSSVGSRRDSVERPRLLHEIFADELARK